MNETGTNSELRYVSVDKDFKDVSRLTAIYDNAFPREERFAEPAEMIAHLDLIPNVDFFVAYDGDIPVGLCYMDRNDGMGYVYVHFLAVDSGTRSKGYGSRIWQKILSDNRDGIVMASIEKPVAGEAGYENKIRRQRFYEKNGMIITDIEEVINGVTFLIITSQTGERFEQCLASAQELTAGQLERLRRYRESLGAEEGGN